MLSLEKNDSSQLKIFPLHEGSFASCNTSGLSLVFKYPSPTGEDIDRGIQNNVGKPNPETSFFPHSKCLPSEIMTSSLFCYTMDLTRAATTSLHEGRSAPVWCCHGWLGGLFHAPIHKLTCPEISCKPHSPVSVSRSQICHSKS